VNQKEVWRVNYLGPWNGGVLTTAGNLVVTGNAAGVFSAYRADNGERLWSTSAQSPVMAAPVTYTVDGEQYIAVLAGWGGIYPLTQGKQAAQSGDARNISRVLVFKLGGAVRLPPVPRSGSTRRLLRPTPRMRPRSKPALSYSPSSVLSATAMRRRAAG
jgi:quinohemoprotein ethanol dehydrogenase